MICRHCKQWLGNVMDDGDHDCLLGQEDFKRQQYALPLKPTRRDPDKGTFLSPDLTDDEARFKAMLAIQAHRRECCARSSHRDCQWEGVFRGVMGKGKDGKDKVRWHPYMGKPCTEETECSSCRKEKAQAARRRVTGADYRPVAKPKAAQSVVITVPKHVAEELRIVIAALEARAAR